MSRRKFNDKDGHESIYRMFNAGLEPMLEQKRKKKEQQKSFRRAACLKCYFRLKQSSRIGLNGY